MPAAAGLGRSGLGLMLLLCLVATPSRPGWTRDAADAAIGPCSPIADPDGDIRSELPSCGRHVRPVPGSLDDELAFRRTRRERSDPTDRPRRRAPHRDEDGEPDE